MLEASRHASSHAVFKRLRGLSSRIGEHAASRPHLATEQVIHGHTSSLAHDVPERAIDSAHRIVRINTPPPIRRDPQRLPDVFDLIDPTADDQRLEKLLDRLPDDSGALGMRAATNAIEAGFARENLHIAVPVAADLRQNHFDIGDLERRKASSGRGLRRFDRGWFAEQLPEGFASSGHCGSNTRAATRKVSERVSSVHHSLLFCLPCYRSYGRRGPPSRSRAPRFDPCVVMGYVAAIDWRRRSSRRVAASTPP